MAHHDCSKQGSKSWSGTILVCNICWNIPHADWQGSNQMRSHRWERIKWRKRRGEKEEVKEEVVMRMRRWQWHDGEQKWWWCSNKRQHQHSKVRRPWQHDGEEVVAVTWWQVSWRREGCMRERTMWRKNGKENESKGDGYSTDVRSCRFTAWCIYVHWLNFDQTVW